MDIRIGIDNDTKPNKNTLRKDNQAIRVLYYDISKYSSTNQFFICCAGVFAFYLIYGYLQELIFTLEGFKPYGWYLTLVQFAFYTIFGFAESNLNGDTTRHIPMKNYMLLALLTLGTMGFSNSSLGYLNYPTQVIFKCCKLIPCLIGSIIIQQKKYGMLDYLAAASLSFGLTLFTLADSKLSPNFNIIGVGMISCALVCDAVIGNVQEKSMKTHGASNTEVVLYSYAIGFVYLLAAMLVSGTLWAGFAFCARHPVVYLYAMLFSVTGYLGIQIVLTLVQTCGALVAVTVTTCRKAVTIILSFLFFAKPFTFQYVWSGLLILLGIYLNVLSKNKSLTHNLSRELWRLIGRFRRDRRTLLTSSV
ncbi:adenosine 3'-phospho 5'-phosphosulfate transporter 2-like [Macrosteles quadrilineatus]|uniref:adenosine 3'-phospho 5'-phosphosulfate transporter 2-like n=1 Tax=Macrosteles quadrilineatus TaxID=74068 RepID=UPI0023E33B01|nr:adenosine 3'-phospho 5'-phosphosulfate transporter 2-like [Macrosteles quadrilineatus]